MKRAAIAIVVLLASACSYSNGYLDRRKGFGGEHVANFDVSEVPVRGSRVVVILEESGSVEGELLAVDDLVYVQDKGDGATVAMRWGEIKEVRVRIARPRTGEPEGSIVWTTVGALSTLSHGAFLLFSLPVWIGAGVPVGIAHGRAIWGKVTPSEMRTQLYQFARYPQGMPPQLRPAASDAGAP